MLVLIQVSSCHVASAKLEMRPGEDEGDADKSLMDDSIGPAPQPPPLPAFLWGGWSPSLPARQPASPVILHVPLSGSSADIAGRTGSFLHRDLEIGNTHPSTCLPYLRPAGCSHSPRCLPQPTNALTSHHITSHLIPARRQLTGPLTRSCCRDAKLTHQISQGIGARPSTVGLVDTRHLRFTSTYGAASYLSPTNLPKETTEK